VQTFLMLATSILALRFLRTSTVIAMFWEGMGYHPCPTRCRGDGPWSKVGASRRVVFHFRALRLGSNISSAAITSALVTGLFLTRKRAQVFGHFRFITELACDSEPFCSDYLSTGSQTNIALRLLLSE
jgi:hypothetical protein